MTGQEARDDGVKGSKNFEQNSDPREARDDEREALIAAHRGVIVAFGDMSPVGNLARRTIRALAEPEITEARIDAAAAILMEGEGPIARVHFAHHYKRKARAMLEAALRVPIGEEEQGNG